MHVSAIRTVFAALVGGLLVVGCGGSSGGGDSDSSTGTASFSVTDAPVDNLTTVQVTFDKIALQPADGQRQTIEIDPPRTIDLLSLTGDASEPILEDTTVPAGDYEFIRLFVIGGLPDAAECPSADDVDASCVAEEDGSDLSLFIPGQQNRRSQSQGKRRFLQLSSGFVVPAGGDADFTIDFQLRKALTKPSNQKHYLLRPSLRLVNNIETDSITGTVDMSLLDGNGSPTSCNNDLSADEGNDVYLYSSNNADVGDVNLDSQGNPDHDTQPAEEDDSVTPEANPITTAEVTQNAEGVYEYTIGFVAEGDYTVAFTCQGLDETVEGDEALEFIQPQNVAVNADDSAEEVNFTATSGS